MRKFRHIITLALVATVGLSLAACGVKEDTVTKQDREQTGNALKKVRGNVAFPKISDSLELRNLKKRYEILDEPNKVGWVYLIDHGLIFAEYQVKGKVSSLNSQFTNPQQISCRREGGERECGVLGQAEPDGSYGSNPDGIFFFTTDGTYVEWGGNYQYSDQRRELTQPQQQLLTKSVK